MAVSNKPAFLQPTPLFAEADEKASEAVFVAPEEGMIDEDVAFAKAESLGRGASKVSFLRNCNIFSSQKNKHLHLFHIQTVHELFLTPDILPFNTLG